MRQLLILAALPSCSSPVPDEFSVYGFQHWSDGEAVSRSSIGSDPRSYTSSSDDGWSVGVGLTWALSRQPTPRYRMDPPLYVELPVELDVKPAAGPTRQDTISAVDDVSEAIRKGGATTDALLVSLTGLLIAAAGWLQRHNIRCGVRNLKAKNLRAHRQRQVEEREGRADD